MTKILSRVFALETVVYQSVKIFCLTIIPVLSITFNALAGSELKISSPWKIETGVRYWYSTGDNSYDYHAGPSTSLPVVSRLDYRDLVAQSGEIFFRLDHEKGLFLKGYFGGGNVVRGELIDDDFPPYIFPHSRTTSQVDGEIGYFNIDIGAVIYETQRSNLGLLFGYHYWHESLDAFGCRQIATNPYICDGRGIPSSVKVITEDDEWYSLRVGLTGDLLLNSRTKLRGEIAYAHIFDHDILDIHYLTFGPDPAKGDGYGIQTEFVLDYRISDRFNIGVGGRWWHFKTDAIDAFGQALDYKTDRYGAFIQGRVKY